MRKRVIRAWHYTRLTGDEVEYMLQQGLHRVNPGNVEIPLALPGSGRFTPVGACRDPIRSQPISWQPIGGEIGQVLRSFASYSGQ